MAGVANSCFKKLREKNPETGKEIVHNQWHLKFPCEHLTIKAIIPSSFPFQGLPEFHICKRGGTEWVDVKQHLLEKRPKDFSEDFFAKYPECLLQGHGWKSIVNAIEKLSEML